MIRAVVVDDEKLVRKGFISLIDWARFGIVMVGEAADGRSALELLERVEVDLLFTDITMPGMSGFDLIKRVRQKFPRMRSVVLTCHHEFDFVQVALRLGAIDYIVKTLFELDNAEEVISRIVERFEWDEGSRATFLTDGNEKRMSTPSALLFSPLSSDRDRGELFQLGIVRRNPLEELNGIWMTQLVHPPSQEDLDRDLNRELLKRWQAAIVTGLDERSLEEVKRTLCSKLPLLFFYSGTLEEPVRFTYGQLIQLTSDVQSQADDSFGKGMDLKWTLDAVEWEAFLRKIIEQQPDPGAIATFALSLCHDWGSLLMKRMDADTIYSDIERNRNWLEWRAWFRRFSDLVQRRMIELSLSKEVMLSLLRAIRYMKLNAGDKINQADVAVHVNMSRSYFSQCFARLAGESFGIILRNMRIDLAKTLLLETTSPIYEIASFAGFEDDKYFSKLFRELVGKLPTEYRIDGGKIV